jgi:four helix bundle protein
LIEQLSAISFQLSVSGPTLAQNWLGSPGEGERITMAQNVQDLVVWQRAIELTVRIYKLTRSFPKEETYGLTSQMRRSSVSVASNIAEGRGRLNPAEFRQFLGMAQGSIFELKTQLLVAKRLAMADEESLIEAESLSEEVSKMLTSFIEKLRPATKKLKADS